MLEVVGAAIRRGDEYLACRRRVDRGGLWEFPGGKVESGESHAQALAREIFEELNVRIRVGDFIAVFESEQLGVRLTTYRATLMAAAPSMSTDHDRLEWLKPARFVGRDWAVADMATVKQLIAESG